MGLILDSSVLVAAERRGLTAKETVSWLEREFPDEELALSVITVMELTHGIARAADTRRGAVRATFLRDLQNALVIYEVTIVIASHAGRMDAACAVAGNRVATADLLIGTTALALGFRVATYNLRHFAAIPGLDVVTMP